MIPRRQTDDQRLQEEVGPQQEQSLEMGTFAGLLSLAPVGVFINHEGRFIYANPAALKLVGATHTDQVLGRPTLDFIAPEFHDMVRGRIERVLSSNTLASIGEERLLRLDGTVVEVETAAWRIPYADSHAVLVSVRPTEERKRAEAALRKSEERIEQQFLELEHLYRTAPVGLLLVDTELRYVRINERLAAINGLPAEAHLGRTVSEVAPGIAATVMPNYQRVLTTGESLVDVEVRGRTPATADTEHFYRSSYHPVKNAAGAVAGVTGVVQDITEQKRAEEALRASERYLQTVLDSMPECVKVLSSDGTLLQMNRAGLHMIEADTPEARCPSPETSRTANGQTAGMHFWCASTTRRAH